jgi:hypothetical protein
MRARHVAVATGIGILLAACAGGFSSTSSPVGTAPHVTAADLVAVAKRVFPFSAHYGYYVVCGVNGDLSKCPITARLKKRLTQAGITLCQCENPAPSIEATGTPTETGGIAHVVLGYQPNQIKMDLVIVLVGGKLLVDDELCTGGDASTSIYTRMGGCGSGGSD